jgi:hypothetical protein
MKFKYTFLSKWTVLILTLITFGLLYLGISLIGHSQPLQGALALLLGLLIYVFAWFIALFDSIQERRWGWLVGLIVLLPLGIAPIVYSLLGPRNTK